MSDWYIRLRLTDWGRWGRYGVKGYPTQSAHLSIRCPVSDSEPPRDIAEIESIVICAEPIDRQVLIAYYVQGGSQRAVAIRLGLTKDTFRRRLDRAVCYVSNNVDNCATASLVSGSL